MEIRSIVLIIASIVFIFLIGFHYDKDLRQKWKEVNIYGIEISLPAFLSTIFAAVGSLTLIILFIVGIFLKSEKETLFRVQIIIFGICFFSLALLKIIIHIIDYWRDKKKKGISDDEKREMLALLNEVAASHENGSEKANGAGDIDTNPDDKKSD